MRSGCCEASDCDRGGVAALLAALVTSKRPAACAGRCFGWDAAAPLLLVLGQPTCERLPVLLVWLPDVLQAQGPITLWWRATGHEGDASVPFNMLCESVSRQQRRHWAALQ